MIAGLSRFVAGLRDAGIAASPAEWLDAVRAVRLIGIEDRELFRASLRATLIKRAGQRSTFERAFDAFFSSPARSGKRKRGRRPAGGGDGNGRSRTGGGSSERSGRHRRERGPFRARLADRSTAPRREGRLRRIVAVDRSEMRGQGSAGPRGADPRRRDLRARLSHADEQEIAAAVPRLIERIRLRTARRVRTAHRGPIYLRRVFRENVAYGGVPFRLPRRQVRRRRSRTLLLIDVSWSCSRAAALFLWMACTFLRLDRPVEATRQIESWVRRTDRPGTRPASLRVRRIRHALPGSRIAPQGRPFGEMLATLPGLNLDAPSDYGRVFHQLLRAPFRRGGRDTVLVILGDGRNNRLDPLKWAMGEFAERFAAALWLVPEPLQSWNTGDSALDEYLPRVDLAVEARDLDGLGRGLEWLIRRLA